MRLWLRGVGGRIVGNLGPSNRVLKMRGVVENGRQADVVSQAEAEEAVFCFFVSGRKRVWGNNELVGFLQRGRARTCPGCHVKRLQSHFVCKRAVSQDATIGDQVAFHSGPRPTTRASPQQGECANGNASVLTHSIFESSSIACAMTRAFDEEILEIRTRRT